MGYVLYDKFKTSLLVIFLFQQPGKFSIEEFETIGTINGIPAHDFSLDSLEDKPWRKPGADITGVNLILLYSFYK